MASATLDKVFKHIDENEKKFIERLSEAVAIKSVSGWPHTRPDCVEMVHWTKSLYEKLGATLEVVPLGKQTMPDGSQLDLPPCLMGHLGKDPRKKTICIYGHLDVQPANKSDGWDTEPFVLTEVNGNLYGRGSTDDKGPVLGWANVIESYKILGLELPVNLKFIFEAMEESGSEGLAEAIMARKSFFDDVSFSCISDNYWIGTDHPCITYGLRGICYFLLSVECAKSDLHSGVHGGAVREAMQDMVALLASLNTPDGGIAVAGVCDTVAPLSDAEKALYDGISFDREAYRKEVGAKDLRSADPSQILMNRWRYPNLSVHGIEGAFSEPGAKTVIPRRVIGKFSIRLVPDQKPEEITRLVTDHLNKVFAARNSPNTMSVDMGHGAPAWMADFKHENFQAAARATEMVYGKKAYFTREGGSIPVTLDIANASQKNVMLLPMGQSDDGAHSNNEKISKNNYMKGTKLMAAYLEECAK